VEKRKGASTRGKVEESRGWQNMGNDAARENGVWVHSGDLQAEKQVVKRFSRKESVKKRGSDNKGFAMVTPVTSACG